MRNAVFTIAVVALVCASASAQVLWADNFDGYTVTPVGTFGASSGGYTSNANGHWDAWYGTVAADGGISANPAAGSTPGDNCLETGGPGVGGSGCDMVQWHEGVANLGTGNYTGFPGQAGAGGYWSYSVSTYVSSALPSGSQSCYFIANDTFNNAGGPATWCQQTKWDHASGTISDDQRGVAGGGVAAPIIYDQWVEFRTDYDLDNDSCSIYYNGTMISTGAFFVTTPAWNTGTGPVQISNLDLFTIDSQIYWDNISLTQYPSPEYGFGPNAYVSGNGSPNGNTTGPALCNVDTGGGLGNLTLTFEVDATSLVGGVCAVAAYGGNPVTLSGGAIPVAEGYIAVPVLANISDYLWLMGGPTVPGFVALVNPGQNAIGAFQIPAAFAGAQFVAQGIYIDASTGVGEMTSALDININ